METKVIILEGDFSEETQQAIAEFIAYMENLEEMSRVASIGGGGFINHKPR